MYASIVLMCILTSILFLGGYLTVNLSFIVPYLNDISYYTWLMELWVYSTYDIIIGADILDRDILMWEIYLLFKLVGGILKLIWLGFVYLHKLGFFLVCLVNIPELEGFVYALSLGFKSSMLIFLFVWARAAYPRVRYDQLMTFTWTVLLPILFALIIFYACVLYSLDAMPVNISLLATPLMVNGVAKKDKNKA